MNCDKAQKILVDYAEGALGEAKRRVVERHLSECVQCRSELSQIESLKQSVLALESPERDAEFWRRFNNKLSQRLAEQETVAAGRRPAWRAGLPLAAAAAAALVIVTLLIFAARDNAPGPSIQLASETSGVDVTEPAAPMLEAINANIFSDMFSAEADFSNGDIEQVAEDMFLLVEEDLTAVPEEMVLSVIYEQSIYDLLEGLSAEEFEDVYEGLASI